MGFRAWLESYGPEVVYLRKYLRERPLDLANHIHWFLHWGGSEAVLERLGVDRDHLNQAYEDSTDEFYDVMRRIEAGMDEREKLGFLEYLLQKDPGETPTWAYMDSPRMLRPDTWLVHFSDEAWRIAQDGFKYGMDDMDRLGLTTYFGPTAKQYGGYNFAFVAGGRHAANAARNKKYGKEAVMFRSAGVSAWHNGDEEEQVVFWGKGVRPEALVYLASDGGEWRVVRRNDGTRSGGSREVAFSGPWERVVGWVEANWFQYRRVL